MAGFEIVVRPVVFPNIRPQAQRVLPPEDDPEKGICEIICKSTHVVSLSFSTSISGNYPAQKELNRRVDKVRITKMNEDGSTDSDSFVDVDVANRITTTEPAPGPKPDYKGDDSIKDAENNANKELRRKQWYRRQVEAPNIEILERDVTRKNTE